MLHQPESCSQESLEGMHIPVVREGVEVGYVYTMQLTVFIVPIDDPHMIVHRLHHGTLLEGAFYETDIRDEPVKDGQTQLHSSSRAEWPE
jgi:hypothetical protein